MPSIISRYNYDIFISYRQNDNRTGWVTEFVKNLQAELSATIKTPVSLYFDSNQVDGLLDTHHVDKSLEGKLNCLIFIPILSQTYCDAKSFAWQYELIPFCRALENDPLGRDIKLANGNVASRILPVKIHEIDREDKKMIEDAMGTAVRSVDFIYTSPGVNRPLKPTDERPDNPNHIYYPDQVNKVANAIKDILHSLPNQSLPHTSSDKEQIIQKSRLSGINPVKSKKMHVASLATGILLLSLFFYMMYDKKGMAVELLDPSIAVLPFTNMSNDPEQEYFSDGITDQIITNLSHLENVKVIARTSVMKYKKTLETIPEIGKELKVNYILEGSVQKAGNRIKINAQLIRTKDNYHAWAEIFNRDLTDIFKVQDDISKSIATALGEKLNPIILRKDRPANLEAYDYFLKARHIAFNQYYWIGGGGDMNTTFQNAKK